jgi:hypothetical protein
LASHAVPFLFHPTPQTVNILDTPCFGFKVALVQTKRETRTVTRKRFNAKKHEAAKVVAADSLPEMATIEDAAKFFRVHPKTIRRRLAAKTLPGTRAGGGPWRLPWSKLREIAGVN